MIRRRRSGSVVRALAAAAALVVAAPACGADGEAGPRLEDVAVDAATYEYTIPVGAGEAFDRGEPLEILPATLEARVGESIRIVNEDDRGHLVGPFFVGAGETLTQRFTEPGTFTGACSVHPSGEIRLVVEE